MCKAHCLFIHMFIRLSMCNHQINKCKNLLDKNNVNLLNFSSEHPK